MKTKKRPQDWQPPELDEHELIEALSKFDEYTIEHIAEEAAKAREEQHVTKVEKETLERISKFPKKTLQSLAKRINKLREGVEFAVKLQPTIEAKGNASWPSWSTIPTWDIHSIDIKWKNPLVEAWKHHGHFSHLRDTIEEAVGMAVEEILYDVDPTDSKPSEYNPTLAKVEK